MEFLIKFIFRTKLISLEECEYIGEFNHSSNDRFLYKYKNKYIILIQPEIKKDIAYYLPKITLKKYLSENQEIELYKKVFGR